ncbi:phage head closure protein [Parabacteroides pacaensis]|uniref:phage head closure protein n=1 Tax=Parabacteroides pacaensis TaxID=2086575 RepID=UPI000D0E5CEB|nr:phage head closure protein [Parabacteroides pacaensis]
MRAGLLREAVVFEEFREVKTTSGFVKKEYVPVLRTKAYRKKLTYYRNEGVNAFEEFTDDTVILQVRRNLLINENLRVRYNDKYYKIRLLDLQITDNTYLITCSKIND